MKYLNTLIIVLIIVCVGSEFYYVINAPLMAVLPDTIIQRIIFYFSFFTVLSCIVFAFGCFVVMFNANYQSQIITVLRLDGVIGILIAGLVYNLALRSLHHPPTLALKITNECLHVVVPILGAMSWLCFDPHPRINKRSIVYCVIPPILYVFYIYIRGALTGLYPYPILDVNQIGYLYAVINTLIVAITFVVFAMLLYFADRHWLAKKRLST